MRDESLLLPDCLRSLEGVADEVVIVDTGSADRSVELAGRSGRTSWRFRGEAASPSRGTWDSSTSAENGCCTWMPTSALSQSRARRLVERLQSAPEVALRILLRPLRSRHALLRIPAVAERSAHPLPRRDARACGRRHQDGRGPGPQTDRRLAGADPRSRRLRRRPAGQAPPQSSAAAGTASP